MRKHVVELIEKLERKPAEPRWDREGFMRVHEPLRDVLAWSGNLRRAGDGAWVSRRLLPLYRAGETRFGPELLNNGNEHVLRDATAKVRSWVRRPTDEVPDSLWVLRKSFERTSVLVAVRLTLEIPDPAGRQRMLDRLSWVILPRILPQRPRRTTGELREVWQASWREHGTKFDAHFPSGTADRLLGEDPGW